MKTCYLRAVLPASRDDPTPLRLETLLPTERAAPLPPPLPPPLRTIVLTTLSMSSVTRSRELARRGSISDTFRSKIFGDHPRLSGFWIHLINYGTGPLRGKKRDTGSRFDLLFERGCAPHELHSITAVEFLISA